METLNIDIDRIYSLYKRNLIRIISTLGVQKKSPIEIIYPVDTAVPFVYNVWTRSNESFEWLKESMKTTGIYFMFIMTSKNEILAGTHRIKALQEMYKEGYQKDKKFIDFFQALCSLLGYRTKISMQKSINPHNPKKHCYIHHVYCKKRDWCIIDVRDFKKSITKEKYNGVVWCPTTKRGAFIARRNGKVFITGNSNMATQFPALGARYLYDRADDGEWGKWIVDPIRDPKIKGKRVLVPCRYDWESRELIQITGEHEENPNKR